MTDPSVLVWLKLGAGCSVLWAIGDIKIGPARLILSCELASDDISLFPFRNRNRFSHHPLHRLFTEKRLQKHAKLHRAKAQKFD